MIPSKLAFLTIGQSPRHDISDAMQRGLPPHVAVVHAGVLDGLDAQEIERRFPVLPGSLPLITRLADGRVVSIGCAATGAGLQQSVTSLEARGIDAIVVLCTGSFPTLAAQRAWLIEPDAIVPGVVASLVRERRVGVLVPLPDQTAETPVKWAMLANAPLCAAASPYGTGRELVAAAAQLKREGADALVLDCMGYNEAHKAILSQALDLPVFVSGTVLAAALSTMFWNGYEVASRP